MTIRYDFEIEKNLIIIRTYDVISIADIEATIKEVEGHANFSKKMAALIDVRETKRAFFVREMDRLVELLANEASAFVKRHAFLVSNDIVLGVGRHFPIKARQRGLELEVFTDHASAYRWLESREMSL